MGNTVAPVDRSFVGIVHTERNDLVISFTAHCK